MTHDRIVILVTDCGPCVFVTSADGSCGHPAAGSCGVEAEAWASTGGHRMSGPTMVALKATAVGDAT